MAKTLRELAETGGESFYRGGIAQKIVAHSIDTGGCLEENDLADHHSDWVEPLSIDWMDVTLFELPPNGQGIAALIALGILHKLPSDLASFLARPNSPEGIHLQVEAMKMALELVERHIADPNWMTVTPSSLLDPQFLKECAGKISLDQSRHSEPAPCRDGGTVYLTAADASGMMVSFIQSNYKGFGSGIVIPETGISLQGRAAGFTLEEGHPNRVAGGKRPFHTIIPAFVMREGKPLMSFGVMGARMQPQGHVQMMVRIFAADRNPQAAADAPRWYLDEKNDLLLEPGFSPDCIAALKARGHHVFADAPAKLFGGAQLILRLDDCWCAASDSRKDGQAAGI
jgi:gamma-glutamyltranspeptidase/glutathione hydrolase